MPTRGNARKIGMRVEASPVSSPRQYGEFALKRQQDRHVHAHPVRDVDGLVRVVEPDVHVQAEDDLLARDEPQLLHEVAVARRGRDPLVLPARERVRAGGADHEALLVGGVSNLTSQ